MMRRRRARRRGRAPLRGLVLLLWRGLRGLWRLGPGQPRDERQG